MPEDRFTPDELDAVFKAYDVRGLVDGKITERLAARVGQAFVGVLGADAVVVGHDMRPSSPMLAGAFADGASRAGADVTIIGLASTDQLYFASGSMDLPGAMFTASHNPAAYNGIKLCRSGARPVGMESGLREIRDALLEPAPPAAGPAGRIVSQDALAAYATHLLDLAPVSGRRLKVVIDAGNGMAGHTAPAVFERLGSAQVEVVPLYFELDGTFPNHDANPLDPTTLVDLQRVVRDTGSDIGLAFDGDADRCFLVDERGELVSPSTLTGLIAERALTQEPGAAIIYNLISSRAVPELVTELGGVPVRTRVGHSFIKQRMAETDAIFGGEHSGHFYFRDFWRADSGMLAALHALAALAEQPEPLSVLLARYERYVSSGEINSEVSDVAAASARVAEHFAEDDDVIADQLDGLTLTHADWTVNVRPSNTEPLLRLNVEGKDAETMVRLRDLTLDLIRRTDVD